jgi:FtsZ-binding cell division protein ZapB
MNDEIKEIIELLHDELKACYEIIHELQNRLRQLEAERDQWQNKAVSNG